MKLRDCSEEAKNTFLTRIRSGTLFRDDDVTPALVTTAFDYLAAYTGENRFLRAIQHDSATRSLTRPQLRGVLNVMLNGLRDNIARRQTIAANTVAQPVIVKSVVKQAKAAERARTERIRLFRVEGRPGVFRTRSKSDPNEHYTVIVADGVEACSCKGFEYKHECKHLEAGRTKVARENARKERVAR